MFIHVLESSLVAVAFDVVAVVSAVVVAVVVVVIDVVLP